MRKREGSHLNVQGMRDKLKRSKNFSWLCAQRKPIIACLQETFLKKELEDKFVLEWNGPTILVMGQK